MCNSDTHNFCGVGQTSIHLLGCPSVRLSFSPCRFIHAIPFSIPRHSIPFLRACGFRTGCAALLSYPPTSSSTFLHARLRDLFRVSIPLIPVVLLLLSPLVLRPPPPGWRCRFRDTVQEHELPRPTSRRASIYVIVDRRIASFGSGSGICTVRIYLWDTRAGLLDFDFDISKLFRLPPSPRLRSHPPRKDSLPPCRVLEVCFDIGNGRWRKASPSRVFSCVLSSCNFGQLGPWLGSWVAW
ncbi:hypothetical protein BDZ97DRAFT_445329 [Flammula alnicola]|nr:hypothetical protein BDZ97DRAFT_445329 [Flammula alnicola]